VVQTAQHLLCKYSSEFKLQSHPKKKKKKKLGPVGIFLYFYTFPIFQKLILIICQPGPGLETALRKFFLIFPVNYLPSQQHFCSHLST
jgi:hypothetical protein